MASPTSTPVGLTPLIAETANADKKLDRLIKNARIVKDFLNPELKPKKRLQSLYNFMEGNSEHERLLFQEYHDVVFQVMLETFNHQAEKIHATKDPTISATVTVDLMKILKVLERILTFLGPELRTGWRRDQIVAILSHLMCESNHSKLRFEGLELLLAYMEVMQNEDKDVVFLHHNALVTPLFVDQGKNLPDLNYTPIAAPDNTVLVHHHHSGQDKQIEGTINMLRKLLEHINKLAEENKRSQTEYFFNMFKKNYLTTFYPEVSIELKLIADNDSRGYRGRCPSRFQAEMLTFLHRWLTLSPDAKGRVLQQILFENEQNLVLMHEMLRQSLKLSYEHDVRVKSTIMIYRQWLTVENIERPSFLRGPESLLEERATTDCCANLYARIYIRHLKQIFETPETRAPLNLQIQNYEQVLMIYRTLSMDNAIKLEPQTWETLLLSLLDVAEYVLNQKKKYSVITDRDEAKNMAKRLMETVFVVLTRSLTFDENMWQKHQRVLSLTTRWAEAVEKWTATVVALTKILSLHVFSLDFDQIPKGFSGRFQTFQSLPPSRRKPKSNGADDTAKISLESETGLFGAAVSITDSFTDFSAVFNQSDSDRLRRIVMDKSGGKTPSKARMILFMWRNMLTVIGNPNSIQSPIMHTDAIKCLVTVLDMLITIRDQGMPIPFGQRPTPPLFEFATWLFQAADLNDDFSAGRALAYGSICRLMCRWNDNAGNASHVPSEATPYLPYFYWAIQKGLDGTDSDVCQAIVGNCTRLFALCLPGSTVLVPTFLRAFRRMFGRGSNVPLPEQCKLDAIVLMCNLLGYTQLYSQTEWTEVQVSVKEILPGFVYRRNTSLSHSTSAGSITEATLQNMQLNDDVHVSKFALGGTDDLSISPLELKEAKTIDLRSQLKDIFVSMIPNKDFRATASPSIHSSLLSAIGLLLCEELFNQTKPDDALVEESLVTLLQYLHSPNLMIVAAVVDLLRFLAQNLERLPEPFLQRMPPTIIFQLQQAIVGHLHGDPSKQQRDDITPLLFQATLDWVMAMNPEQAQQANILEALFAAIELALNVPATFEASHNAKENTGGVLLRRKPSHRAAARNSVLPEEDRPGNVPQIVVTSGFSGDALREMASDMLLHLLHHFNNFPSVAGPEILSSLVLESDDVDLSNESREVALLDVSRSSAGPSALSQLTANSKTAASNATSVASPSANVVPSATNNVLYYIINDSTIVSVVEIASPRQPGATEARVIIRDMSGRYSWDSCLFYQHLQEISQKGAGFPRYEDPSSLTTMASDELYVGTTTKLVLGSEYSISASPPPRVVPLESYYRRASATQAPLFEPNAANGAVDMVDQLLQYVSAAVPEYSKGRKFNVANTPNEEIAPLSAELEKHITAWNVFEAHQAANFQLKENSELPAVRSPSDNSKIKNTEGIDPRLQFQPEVPPKLIPAKSPMHRVRLLLSHLGFLAWDPSQTHIALLDKASAKLQRSLNSLDKQNGREQIKLGVLYVGHGQETQQAILTNEKGSQDYEDFVSALGWEVDVSNHAGYLGGLESNWKSGAKAPYFCSSSLEVIFHVATRMPTDKEDPVQVKKKRHLGNDEVNIVWNDHYRVYDTHSIPSEVTEVYIVITPLPNKLYFVEIQQKKETVHFGPLLHGMVVSRAVLAPAVRMTAINAFRRIPRVRVSADMPTRLPNPYTNRLQIIQDLSAKCKLTSVPFEQFMRSVFPGQDTTTTPS